MDLLFHLSLELIFNFTFKFNGLPIDESSVVDSVEPKSEPSTETILYYNQKQETVAPLYAQDANSMVNEVSVDKVTVSPVAEPEPEPSSYSEPVVDDSEKKTKKGKSEEKVFAKDANALDSSEKVVKATPTAGPVNVEPVETVKVSEVVATKSESPELNSVVFPVGGAVAAAPVGSEVKVDPKPDSSSADISAYLSEPINQATKLLVDLEEQIKGYLNSDLEDAAVSTLSPQSYGAVADAEIEPTLTDARQNDQLTGMVEQISLTINNLDTSIDDLMANRRYMTAAMMRSMRSYLRGVQNNLQRLQNRLRALQAVASSASGQSSSASSPEGEVPIPGSGFPSNAFFESLRVRVNRITSDITNLMNRMRSTLVSSTTARP